VHVTRRHPMLLCLLAVVIGLSGCDRLYYGTMKKLGYEKRDILINRVKDARKAQREAQEEFKSALERFREVIEVDGGTLESKYDQLNRELQRAEKRAREVTDRVNSVKSVSDDLFREWNKELSQYADRGMRAESQRELQATRKRTEALIAAMRRSEQRIEPVLRPLRDRVLFLKHNLNAKALGAITAELTAVESSVDTLVAELQKAIAEADAYLAEMEKAQAGDAQG
jgi:chromosome segregation ATPase